MPVFSRQSSGNHVAAILVCIAALITFSPTASALQYGESGAFPAAEFMGLQITYQVKGADILTEKVTQGKENHFLELTGKLANSGTLQISGKVNGKKIELPTSDKPRTYEYFELSYIVNGKNFGPFRLEDSMPFNITLPLPYPDNVIYTKVRIHLVGKTRYNSSTVFNEYQVGMEFTLQQTGGTTPKTDPPKTDPPKPVPPKDPLLLPPNTDPPNTQPPSGGGTVTPPNKPPVKTPDKATEVKQPEKITTQPPAKTEGTDWKKIGLLTVAATAGVLLAGVVIGAVAGTCVLATFTELTTGLLSTMSPLLLRITVGMFQTPYLGGAMRGIYKAALVFTMTGMPKLTMLWTNFGIIKDYLANSDFRARLGEAKFPSNWDYDKGPSGGRRER